MIEATLEEDVPTEFRGGTLRLKKAATDITGHQSLDKRNSLDKNTQGNSSDKNCYWGAIPLPLSSISSKITESLWSVKAKPVTPPPFHEAKPLEPRTEPISKVQTSVSQNLQPKVNINQEATNYFTFRDGVVDRASHECAEEFLNLDVDGPVIASFLLTQINHWDTDKERLVILTPKTLLVIKYDFIALKRLSCKKLPLQDVEAVIVGNLVYPPGSLIPSINGMADGISTLLENCLTKHISNDNQTIDSFSSTTRNRNMKGIRILFANQGKPVNFASKWNPFREDIPVWTFTFHPLYFHQDCTDENLRKTYDLEHFTDEFLKVFLELAKINESRVLQSNILLENYIGLGAIIHNRHDLGFFKKKQKKYIIKYKTKK